jgi:hypothetical protein
MVEPEMEGVAESQAALGFWKEEWKGRSFMAIGMDDPDVETMQTLRASIRRAGKRSFALPFMPSAISNVFTSSDHRRACGSGTPSQRLSSSRILSTIGCMKIS